MQKRKQPILKLSLLSCAIALAAGQSNTALAVELCSGDTSITLASGAGGDTCNLDTTDARLTVIAGGKIDSQVYVTAAGTVINNAGSISATGTSAIYYDGVDLDASLTNSGQIVGTDEESSYAYAYGIYMDELAGRLGNSGTIRAHAQAEYYYANATALDVSNGLSGSLTNGGRIESIAEATSGAYAYGVDIGGDLSGELVNNGIIRSEATGTDGYAYASALYISGEVSGELRNAGTIEAVANGADNSASAYALYVSSGDFTSTSTFANGGKILAQATSLDYEASAYAVYLSSGKLDTVLSNGGTINATATSYGSTATAQAIYLNTGIGGDGGIVNTGTISASAKGGDRAYATALEIGGEHSYITASSGTDYAAMSGAAAIVNSGTIRATADGRTSDGEAYAVYISGDLAESARIQNNAGGTIAAVGIGLTDSATASAIYAYDMRDNATILNNGVILAQANSVGDEAYAYGIDVDSMYDDASIVNNKTLKVIASGQDEVSAYGIEADYLYDNAAILNNGTLEVKASSLTDSASAYGIYAYSLYDNARVVNNGTLTVTAEGPDYSAYASGISVDSLYDSASVVNDGTLVVTATADEYSATAYGIYAEDIEDDASLVNSGKIEVSATGYSSAEAHGIYAYSLYNNGVLLNEGTIKVSAIDGTSSAEAYGISADSVNDDAALINDGKIEVTAHGRYDAYAYAYGIDMDDVSNNGAVRNTSLIRATATVDGTSSAYAYGIDMGSIYDNATVVNSGSIIASATSKVYQSYAYGIAAGSISSAGDVGTLDPEDDIHALTNAAGAVIAAYAEGQTSASAYGIEVDDLSGSASITNNGTIIATALNHYSSSVYAYGIETGSLSNTATITNNGSITAMATNKGMTGGDSASAYGILTYNVDAGTAITNNGSIKVGASAEQGSAYAYGIHTAVMSGSIENTGTIEVSASSKGDDESAYAVYAGGSIYGVGGVGAEGEINNSGTMNGGVYAGTNYFYGSCCWVYLGSSAINLSNSGSITTHAQSDSYVSGDYTQLAGGSLGFVMRNEDDYAQLTVNGTADFSASSTVEIHVDPKATLADGDVLDDVIYANTLVANADGFAVSDTSAFYNFIVAEDANGFDLTVDALDPASVLAGAGMTLTGSQADLLAGLLAGEAPEEFDPLLAALNGAGTAGEAAAVVEAFGPALSGAASFATRVAGQGASNAISARMGEARGASSGDAFTQNAVWIKPFLGMAEQDDANGQSGYDVDTTGFVIGMDGDVNDDLRVGVAIASAQSELDGRVANVDIDTTQLTVYGSYALGSATALDLDLSYGANSYDSHRRVTFAGSTAIAEYDGTQLALGVALSHRFAMGEKAALVPSLSVRYSQVELDGYSETGAAPFNLTVADSDDDAILAVAKAGYELTLANKGVFLANLGLGIDTIDQASATATVSGAGQTFVSNGIEPDDMLVVGGLGYRHVTAKGLEITGAWDVESRSDFLGNNLSVKFRLPF